MNWIVSKSFKIKPSVAVVDTDNQKVSFGNTKPLE